MDKIVDLEYGNPDDEAASIFPQIDVSKVASGSEMFPGQRPAGHEHAVQDVSPTFLPCSTQMRNQSIDKVVHADGTMTLGWLLSELHLGKKDPLRTLAPNLLQRPTINYQILCE
jgi:hypothetical protein